MTFGVATGMCVWYACVNMTVCVWVMVLASMWRPEVYIIHPSYLLLVFMEEETLVKLARFVY